MNEDPLIDVIRRNRCEISDTVRADVLFPFLQSHGVICDEETQEIKNKSVYPTRQGQTNRLVDLLERRDCGFVLLLGSLQGKYPQLHEKLLSQCVELVCETATPPGSRPDGSVRHALGFYRSEADALRRKCEERQKDVEIAVKERAEAYADLEALESQLETAFLSQKSEIAALKDLLKEQRAQNSRLITEKETAWNHRDRVQAMSERIYMENNELKRQVADLKAKLDELVTSSSECHEDLIQELKEKLVESENHVYDLKTKLADAKEKSRRISIVSGGNPDFESRLRSRLSLSDSKPVETHVVELDCQNCIENHGIELSVTTTVKSLQPSSCAQNRLQKGDVVEKIGSTDLETALSAFASHFLRPAYLELAVRHPLPPFYQRHVSGQSSRSSFTERHSPLTQSRSSFASGGTFSSGFNPGRTESSTSRSPSVSSLPDAMLDFNDRSDPRESLTSPSLSLVQSAGLSASLPTLTASGVGHKQRASNHLIRQVYMKHSKLSSCPSSLPVDHVLPGDGGSLFIRTLFKYGSRGTDEHGFEPQSVFRVVRRDATSKPGYWEAYSLDKFAKDKPPSKFIPDKKMASRLKAKNYVLENSLKKKMKSAVTRKMSEDVLRGKRVGSVDRDSAFFATDMDENPLTTVFSEGYEVVHPVAVNYCRPIVLLGILTSQIAEVLMKFSFGLRFIRSSSVDDLKNFAHEGYHYIMEDDPSTIETLENMEVSPIVIFLTAKSRKLSKAFPGGVSKEELERQFKKADELRHQHGAHFSGTIYVEPTTKMAMYAPKICEMIKEEQKSIVWNKVINGHL
eukprot:m.307858 g.307858  ORF g.307858 m.307858 type:complete len:801 (+) comp42948_c0_seq1:2355-4757(+)